MATRFCTVARRLCGSSVLSLLHVTILAPLILTRLHDFWKIRVCLAFFLFSVVWCIIVINTVLLITNGWWIVPGSPDKTGKEMKNMTDCKVILQHQHEGTEGGWPPISSDGLLVPSTDNPTPSYWAVLKSSQSIATSHNSMLSAIVGCMIECE